MNKNELVSAVADSAGLSKSDAQAAIEAVFDTITRELKKGGDVRLVGFGNFSVSRRDASTGRNPQTGAAVKIPARNVPKFTAGKGLKDAVN
jgi:DNA-binding protein HU-beta